MKYKVIRFLKRLNWEGCIIEDQEGKQFITNGIYKWEARPERIEKCEIVNSIDKEKLLNKWNQYFSYNSLVF